MKTILLSANFGFQKSYKNLNLHKIFCTFHSKGYEQYFNPITAKKRALKEIVKQKKECKEIIGKMWIRLPRPQRIIDLCHFNITQEDIDRTKEQMYPNRVRPVMIKRQARRTHNNMFFHPVRR